MDIFCVVNFFENLLWPNSTFTRASGRFLFTAFDIPGLRGFSRSVAEEVLGSSLFIEISLNRLFNLLLYCKLFSYFESKEEYLQPNLNLREL